MNESNHVQEQPMQTHQISALVAGFDGPDTLDIKSVDYTPPHHDQSVIGVEIVSLNRGEVGHALAASSVRRVGWDIVGVVERAADNGTGPAQGTRVVGFCRAQDGWAQRVNVPTEDLAAVPAGVSAERAATLPVAGLTALYSVDRGKDLVGSRALVTGATGGVGAFAVQIARAAGAHVTAQVRSQSGRQFAEQLGADDVLVSDDAAGLDAQAKFGLIVDGVGGPLLTNLLSHLTADGLCVTYAGTADASVSLNVLDLVGAGRAALTGLNLYAASAVKPAGEGLERLLRLATAGRLSVPIERDTHWSETHAVATELRDRRFSGKAVVRLS